MDTFTSIRQRRSRGPDGRVKIVCQSGSPEQIRAFMEPWAPAQGLQVTMPARRLRILRPAAVDRYGDPAHGFAGGHAIQCEVAEIKATGRENATI